MVSGHDTAAIHEQRLQLCAAVLSLACEGAANDHDVPPKLTSSRPVTTACVPAYPITIDQPEFGRVAGAVFLADTLLVVADDRNLNLTYFTLQGNLVRVAGRRGSGPGEFLSIGNRVTSLGDSAVFYDTRLRRFSLFTADGRFLRTIAPAGVGDLDQPITLLPHDEYLATTWVNAAPSVRTRTVLRFDTVEVQIRSLRDGSVRATLARVPDWSKIVNHSRGFSIMPHPFGSRPNYVLTGTENLIIAVDSMVHRFNHKGAELTPLWVSQTPMPVTPSDIERWIDHYVSFVEPQRRAWTRGVYSESVPPAFMPVHGSGAVDRLGSVWLSEYRPPYDTSGVSVRRVDLKGGASTAITANVGGSLLAAAPKALAVLVKDALDVETVRIYPLSCK